jgi:hypothetical protein
MLPDAKYYDVWIVKSNQVIREIPAATILQWIAEKRLIGRDKIRPSGTADSVSYTHLTLPTSP